MFDDAAATPEEARRFAANRIILFLQGVDEFRNCRVIRLNSPEPVVPDHGQNQLRIGIDLTKTPDSFRVKLASAARRFFAEESGRLYHVGTGESNRVEVLFDNCLSPLHPHTPLM